MRKIQAIINKVRKEGDAALRYYAKKFDGTGVNKIKIRILNPVIPGELQKAIKQAKQNIEKFHSSQLERPAIIETMPGVKCWRRSVGIEKVGLYVPGGKAPLFSTVLMLAVPAKLAGCKEIILCTPSLDAAILYTAKLCGIDHVYNVGGAQAIAAMAYGTETIPKVQKIFGPGNKYVTMAKQLVQVDGIAVDIPAGPSELLIIADDSAIPEFVLSDLLSQAEHGPDSRVILVTTSTQLLGQIDKRTKGILVKNLDDAIRVSNEIAPEHLTLACRNAGKIARKVINAGSVFIGNYSACAAGDYASGTNHSLPTNGYAAVCSGVSVDSFVKKITYQQLTKEGLKKISKTVMVMAQAEGLTAHKKSIEIRL
jgi:histidinol dehydrogenase